MSMYSENNVKVGGHVVWSTCIVWTKNGGHMTNGYW